MSLGRELIVSTRLQSELARRPEAYPDMRKVSVIQREIPHYRIRFFEELYAQGRLQDLDIHVYCGVPPVQKTSSNFSCHVLPVRYFGGMKSTVHWLRGLGEAIVGSDVVVAPQELQCLTIPYLWVRRKQICKTWIWWGHGYNFQAAVRPSVRMAMKERIREFVTRRGDGLLTYSDRGADYWRARGVPEGWARPYYNTIDVEEVRKARAEIRETQRLELRRKLILEGKHVLLFSGRLYAEKRVDVLLRAFAVLKRSCPNVALLIMGDGEEREGLHQLAKALELQDVHFLGEVVTPKATAEYFSLADLLVIPGLVGLAIVHGFACGIPIVTTSVEGHGPEIEYLSESNGVMTQLDILEYANALAGVMASPHRLEAMKRSAMAKGDDLKLSHSVQRFVEGIQHLHAPHAA